MSSLKKIHHTYTDKNRQTTEYSVSKKESIDKIQPKLSAIERNTNRLSLDRSGSFRYHPFFLMVVFY